ncbi:heme-binding protein [Catenulispora sp. NF23]|uniref:Heme-binding protein n=1 Tax=Catenulispora pinistramenti TaxID=2705254 RepID=A0ABS5KP31_9ACTN|nr:heme-binding protein [Catenulispora pinistramenti]MBS2532275.1 heme-binding protein [Catenulispora pinistramenti]MBS2547800.1 heme-binding protein [Catenulispora pinistramenti]
MTTFSTRARVITGAAGLAVVGAATFGALSANADAKTDTKPDTKAANAKGLITTQHLSAASATKAAQAALNAATKAGQHVSVAVVDRDGNVIVQLRGDGAGPQSFDSAEQKAFTAVSWNNKTSALVNNLQQTPTLKDIPGTLFLAGGVPVDADNAPVAGVGVAGAPSGAMDEAYAQAGADAITR